MYYPMTSSISNGLVALYGSDERIINNNNNNKSSISESVRNYISLVALTTYEIYLTLKMRNTLIE